MYSSARFTIKCVGVDVQASKFSAYFRKFSRWVLSSIRITLGLLLLVALAALVPKGGAHFFLFTEVQLPIDCQASRSFLSAIRSVSSKTSFKAALSTSVRVLVHLFFTQIMSLAFMLVESSSERMTLGATYGCTVPGGACVRSRDEAVWGLSKAQAAKESSVLRKCWGVLWCMGCSSCYQQ